MYSVTKFAKEQKKSQLKFYRMILHIIKNLLSIKDILKHSHPVVLATTLKFEKTAFQKNNSEGT